MQFAIIQNIGVTNLNSFTVAEIKQSVYYRWRMNNVKICMSIWGVVSAITLLVPLFGIVRSGLESLAIGFTVWGVMMAFYGLIFGAFALHYYSKARFLVKNYKNFKQYEAVLDSPETSYWYRGAIYYNVTIKDGNTSVVAQTNACFSGMLFSKFTLEDYNNKKVVGLFDPESERFYVVKRVN